MKNKLIHYIQTVSRIFLGALLLIAGTLKLQDNTALFETIAYITWLPLGIKSFVIDVLPWIEVLVGALLIVGLYRKIIIPAGVLIYTGFFIFAIYGLGSGMEGDCGCFGEADGSNILAMVLGSTFGWPMVIRNGLFVAMAGILFWKPKNRNVHY